MERKDELKGKYLWSQLKFHVRPVLLSVTPFTGPDNMLYLAGAIFSRKSSDRTFSTSSRQFLVSFSVSAVKEICDGHRIDSVEKKLYRSCNVLIDWQVNMMWLPLVVCAFFEWENSALISFCKAEIVYSTYRRMGRISEVHQLRYPGDVRNEGNAFGIVVTSRCQIVLVLAANERPTVPATSRSCVRKDFNNPDSGHLHLKVWQNGRWEDASQLQQLCRLQLYHSPVGMPVRVQTVVGVGHPSRVQSGQHADMLAEKRRRKLRTSS